MEKQETIVIYAVMHQQRTRLLDRPVSVDANACAAAREMQKFWHNVTKAGEVEYGPRFAGSFAQVKGDKNGGDIASSVYES